MNSVLDSATTLAYYTAGDYSARFTSLESIQSRQLSGFCSQIVACGKSLPPGLLIQTSQSLNYFYQKPSYSFGCVV